MTPSTAAGQELAHHQNTMPRLVPVPIETKGKHPLVALWIWARSTREWRFEANWDFHVPHIGHSLVIPKDFVFDGASVPKRLRAYLSPVGLLLVPGVVHDFGYRYDYVWIRNADGTVSKAYERAGRKHWDRWFFLVGNFVNGVFIINLLARIALTLAGWWAWRSNRNKAFPELTPAPIAIGSPD